MEDLRNNDMMRPQGSCVDLESIRSGEEGFSENSFIQDEVSPLGPKNGLGVSQSKSLMQAD
jgi:hypothetical protein